MMRDRMQDIMTLARIELVIIALFVLFKFIRPRVLEYGEPELLQVIMRSLPNFFEAIIGTLTLTGIGLIITDRWKERFRLPLQITYLLAVVLAGIYVFTQEFNLHHLGGNNTFDPNDLIFSFFGLVVAYGMVLRIKPRIPPCKE